MQVSTSGGTIRGFPAGINALAHTRSVRTTLNVNHLQITFRPESEFTLAEGSEKWSENRIS